MNLRTFSLLRPLFGLVAFAASALAAAAQVTLPAATVGTAYSFQVTTSPAAPVGTVYSATGLPGGLAINASSGAITGTPSAPGVAIGVISLVSGSVTNNYSYSLTVNAGSGTPAITSATTASATVNTAFTYSVTASNGPITGYNVSGLPPGLAANSTTGAISGTPTTAGTYPVSLSANNASGSGSAVTLTITVAAAVAAPVISSATTASVAVSASFSYTITASNTPTSFAASGLPLGVSLNTNTGAITGTPTVAGIYTIALTASNASGAGATVNLTLTVGSLSAITSAATASGALTQSFNYTLTGSNTATSFNVSSLPPGLAANTTTGAITGLPTTIGTYTVTASANNAVGTGANSTLTFTIAAAPVVPPTQPPVVPPTTPPVSPGAPAITTQPASQQASAGAAVTFSVEATGTGLNYQWFKNGGVIAGQLSSTLTFASVTSSDAGTYSVYVSNTSGSVTSSEATLTLVVVPPPPLETVPGIATHPTAQSVASGGSASLTVVANGTSPFTYQWRKDGVAIAGATNATLALTNVLSTSAGSYTVVVTNSVGSATSNAAVLAVASRGIAGAYFGTFGGNGGTFALLVRSDGTAVFLGYARAANVAFVSRDVVVDSSRRFQISASPLTALAVVADHPVAAALNGYAIDGTISADGAISGSVSGLNLTLSAPAAQTSGTSATSAGFYQAGAAGSSATSYTIVGAAGDAYVATISGTNVDAGKGTIDAGGNIVVTTENNARVAGTVDGQAKTISLGVTPSTGTAVTFVGDSDDDQKLINISTRSRTGTATDTLIAGFVITGTTPKPVLVRAIGPTLATFGVNGVLSAVRLELFRGQTSVAVGTDWGVPSNNPTEIAATAVRVGAFALPANSRDAALVLNLAPDSYTAVVTGQGGVSGVALVEVYDATTGAIPQAQRVVNIATRATAGTSDSTLIAGFVISGAVPKRVLIRGAGPSLTQFGVTGALARPQLVVNSGNTILVQNAGWSTSPDASAIAAGSAQVGAFAFGATSLDAALIVNLAPGAYTAQVSGVGGTTGVALIEVYELP